jgi:hypothetical protein
MIDLKMFYIGLHSLIMSRRKLRPHHCASKEDIRLWQQNNNTNVDVCTITLLASRRINRGRNWKGHDKHIETGVDEGSTTDIAKEAIDNSIDTTVSRVQALKSKSM